MYSYIDFQAFPQIIRWWTEYKWALLSYNFYFLKVSAEVTDPLGCNFVNLERGLKTISSPSPFTFPSLTCSSDNLLVSEQFIGCLYFQSSHHNTHTSVLIFHYKTNITCTSIDISISACHKTQKYDKQMTSAGTWNEIRSRSDTRKSQTRIQDHEAE